MKRLLLTASGGPFRERPRDTFDRITREEALAHPTWHMGPKISIDSATMMNKGLEVIEGALGSSEFPRIASRSSSTHSRSSTRWWSSWTGRCSRR